MSVLHSFNALDVVQFWEKFAFCIISFATQHSFATHSVQLRYEGLLLMMVVFDDGHFSWWLLNEKLRKTTMLLKQCTVHIWDYPANYNHNVQLGVAKECWVAKLFCEMRIFLETVQHLAKKRSWVQIALLLDSDRVFQSLLISERLNV